MNPVTADVKVMALKRIKASSQVTEETAALLACWLLSKLYYLKAALSDLTGVAAMKLTIMWASSRPLSS
jgi:hypothetical protein